MAFEFTAIKSGGGVPSSPKDMGELRLKAVAANVKLQSLAETAKKRILREKEKIDADTRQQIERINQSPRANKQQAIKEAQADGEHLLMQARKEILAETQKERVALIHTLENYRNNARIAKNVCVSPINWLPLAAGMGTPRQGVLLGQLSVLNSHQLALAAQNAVSQNDIEAASVILTVAAQMKDSAGKPAKPFNTFEFAQAMVGKECDSAVEALREIEVCHSKALATEQELSTGKNIPGFKQIQIAVDANGVPTKQASRDDATPLTGAAAEASKEAASLAKISRGWKQQAGVSDDE